jgi:hypothetical protein
MSFVDDGAGGELGIYVRTCQVANTPTHSSAAEVRRADAQGYARLTNQNLEPEWFGLGADR